MIRLIQRRLIIPRGDTGSFSIPVLSKGVTDNIAVFTIFDETTHTKMFQKMVPSEGDVINIAFTHNDTVNLKPGKYVWDIKYYSNPEFVDEELVNGEEIDSYYAGFSLPVCEIRETADNYLVSPDAPNATLSPSQLDIITSAINDLNEAIRKTGENVEHYPEIRNDVWYVWDAEQGDYVSTNVPANGIAGNGIESAVLNNDYTLTLNFTDGTSFTSSSIRGETGNGIDDIVLNNDFTLTISYTDGESYTTPSIRGPVGLTPQFSIGNVQDGAVAAASITGTAENPVLNLTLPNAHVPTKVSQLQNDSGYLTQEVDPTVPQWAKEPTKPSYTPQEVGALPANTYIPQKTSDLTNDSNYAVDANYVHTDNNYTTAEKNKLNGIAAGAEVNVNADWNANSGDAQILNKPTKVSDFTNDAGYLTEHQDISGKADRSEIPTKVSQLQNDSGYLTSFTETDPTVPAWAKAAQKPSYTASEVGAPTVAEMNTAIGTAISQINSFDMAVVQTLPTQNISTHTIYLVPKTGETNDVYDEYVYINNNWEMVGNTQIDLSDYALKSELPDVPVQDVQVNGASVLSNGVANVPVADANTAGVIKVFPGYGLEMMEDGNITFSPAPSNLVKTGVSQKRIIAPYNQHESTFYGLAKAAGDSTQSASENAVGTYTDEAKAAIQQMLDVPSTNDIPEVPVQDVQVNGVSVVTSGVAEIPIAGKTTEGVVKVKNADAQEAVANGGSVVLNGVLYYTGTTDQSALRYGYDQGALISTSCQHTAAFYGLAKAAGVAGGNAGSVGTYTDSAKSAIRSMIGAASPNVIAVQDTQPTDADTKIWLPETAETPIQVPTVAEMNTALAQKVDDVQVNGVSVVTNGVANVPFASVNTPGVAYIYPNNGINIQANGRLIIYASSNDLNKAGGDWSRPIVPAIQHSAAFYGLSKAAGVDLANETVTLGTYPETSKTAIKEMLGVQDGLKVVRLI